MSARDRKLVNFCGNARLLKRNHVWSDLPHIWRNLSQVAPRFPFQATTGTHPIQVTIEKCARQVRSATRLQRNKAIVAVARELCGFIWELFAHRRLLSGALAIGLKS